MYANLHFLGTSSELLIVVYCGTLLVCKKFNIYCIVEVSTPSEEMAPTPMEKMAPTPMEEMAPTPMEEMAPTPMEEMASSTRTSGTGDEQGMHIQYM